MLTRKVEDATDLKNASIISKNLQSLMAIKHLNELQLSKNTDINLSTIRRLVSGVTPDPRISTLVDLCSYFEISLDDLLDENFDINQHSEQKLVSHLIPLLRWNALTETEANCDKWLPITLSREVLNPKDLFALESTPSMKHKFPEGTVFIVDKNESPCDGDMVIVKINDERNVTLRYLSIDASESMLLPIIATSSPIIFDHQKHQVCGTVILTMKYIK